MNRTTGLFAALALSLLASSPVLAQTAPTSTTAHVSAAREGDRSVGSSDAPVTLTAYLSTTCSHCAEWHNNVLPQITAKYVDTGQVRIVYRDLPTPPHDIAGAGAVMARCVPEDKFAAALDSLFQTQSNLAPAAGQTQTEEQLQDKAMVWLAGAGLAGGLTRDQMNACFDNEANWTALDARVEASRADGVRGTPTFFVNGERANIDPHDPAAFDAAIQPQLAAH